MPELGNVLLAITKRSVEEIAKETDTKLTPAQIEEIATKALAKGNPVQNTLDIEGQTGDAFGKTLSGIDKGGYDNTIKDVEDTFARASNPRKYLTPEQEAANLATATRLAKSTFGESFNDPDMIDFLSGKIAEGESPFEISQFLQTTPQYVETKQAAERQRVSAEAAAARNALDQSLQAQEEEAFARAAPQIISSYMKAGRLNSSGLNAALAKARQELQSERQARLANIAFEDSARAQGYGREDFVNNESQAYAQYLRQNDPAYRQRFSLNDTRNFLNFQAPFDRLNRSYSVSDSLRNRGYENQDYARERNDFYDALSRNRRDGRSAALYGLGGNLAGSALNLGLLKGFGAF